MTSEQLSRELNYGVRANIAKRMLSKGLISEREYRLLCTKYERKFEPMIGGYIPPQKPYFT